MQINSDSFERGRCAYTTLKTAGYLRRWSCRKTSDFENGLL